MLAVPTERAAGKHLVVSGNLITDRMSTEIQEGFGPAPPCRQIDHGFYKACGIGEHAVAVGFRTKIDS
jgi:hypothetical protein